jgi:hypothetical protein
MTFIPISRQSLDGTAKALATGDQAAYFSDSDQKA